MSTEPRDQEMSQLQQDLPVSTLPELSGSKFMKSETKAESIKDTTKPFFLYPRDGLYGLL